MLTCLATNRSVDRAIWRTARACGAVMVFGALGLPLVANAGPAVQCHLAYGGSERIFTIAPTPHTAEVLPLVQGASLAFEVVNRLPPEPGAGVQVSTYAMLEGQPVLIHRGTYAAPADARGPHGFTGLQVVREPLRGNELSYWCERPAP